MEHGIFPLLVVLALFGISLFRDEATPFRVGKERNCLSFLHISIRRQFHGQSDLSYRYIGFISLAGEQEMLHSAVKDILSLIGIIGKELEYLGSHAKHTS